jgi:V8-like Glu-specific endopeptidase
LSLGLGAWGCASGATSDSATDTQAAPLQSEDAFWTETELSKDRVIGGTRYVHVRKVDKWGSEGEYEAREARRKVKERADAEQGIGLSSRVPTKPKRTREQLAEDMRGVAYFRGHEYRQAEPAWAAADAILNATDEHTIAPPKSAATNNGERPPEDYQGQAIQGTDSRQKRRDNTSYPMRAQMVLEVGGFGCTATLIGPTTALTAAHCLHTGSGWRPGDWRTAPGADRDDVINIPIGFERPYGTYTCHWGTVPGAWINGDTAVENDYAVIDYSGCNLTPGNTVGWLGVWSAGEPQLAGQSMYVYGYPGKQSDCVGGCNWPTIWGIGDSANTGTYGSDSIKYDTDTTGGQSGAGVYIFYGGSRYLVGIHKGENWSIFNGWFNYGRRANEGLLSFIEATSQWRRSPLFPGGNASQ